MVMTARSARPVTWARMSLPHRGPPAISRGAANLSHALDEARRAMEGPASMATEQRCSMCSRVATGQVVTGHKVAICEGYVVAAAHAWDRYQREQAQ